jgi:flagellar motor protein MotB
MIGMDRYEDQVTWPGATPVEGHRAVPAQGFRAGQNMRATSVGLPSLPLSAPIAREPIAEATRAELRALARSHKLTRFALGVVVVAVAFATTVQILKERRRGRGESDRADDARLAGTVGATVPPVAPTVAEAPAPAATGPANGASEAPAAPGDHAGFFDELKHQLENSVELTVEGRDDRAVISFPASAVFDGVHAEPGISGYRLLFHLRKALKGKGKGWQGYQARVTASGGERKKLEGGATPTTWHLAAARAVSLARFLVDEAGLDARNVATATAPAEPVGRARASGFEIVLSLAP